MTTNDGAPPLTEAQIEQLKTWVPPLRGLGRVGILGGSFNPPHIGHLLLAAAVYASEEIDHLWVLPCADHAFGKPLAPFADRVRMCHLAFRHLAGGAAVLDLENRLPRPPGTPSYTVDTLRALHAVRPGIKPRWIAGSDIVADLPRWREPDEVQRLCKMIFVPRKGFPSAGTLQLELPEVSSTDVRDRIADGRSVEGLLDREVIQLIERRELYRPSAGPPP